MEKDNLIKIIILCVIWAVMFYVSGWFCGWMIGKKNHPSTNQINLEHPIIDSTKQKLDSIEYNIIYKDTIIYRIKEEMINDIKQVQTLDDSSAVIEFKKLVSEQ